MLKISTGALITIITAGILLTIATAGIISINPATLSQENDEEPYPTDAAVPSQENDEEPYPTDAAVPSQENISTVNVGVYSDAACNQELTSIDWGDIFPGESVNKIIYVKNTGNTKIKLTMTATNWNPSTANESITLTWNKEKTTLNADEIKEARLTLFVSQDICDIANFSMDIVITGMVDENP
jgi:hypothetical protein